MGEVLEVEKELGTWGHRDTTTEQADKIKRSLYKNLLLLTPDQPALPARYYININIYSHSYINIHINLRELTTHSNILTSVS